MLRSVDRGELEVARVRVSLCMPGRLFRLVEKGLQGGCLLSRTTDLRKPLLDVVKPERYIEIISRIQHTIGSNDNVALYDIAITKQHTRLLKVDSLDSYAEPYLGIQPSRLVEQYGVIVVPVDNPRRGSSYLDSS